MTKPRGFTVVELAVTLLIVGVLLSLGIISMRGYIPKHRLSASVSLLAGLLTRAQTEATARSYWTCIKIDPNVDPITATLWIDAGPPTTNPVNRVDASCGEGGTDDFPLKTFSLKKDVTLPDATGVCANSLPHSCVIWFDSTGSPKRCNGCDGGPSASDPCVGTDYQIILSNKYLDSGARSREIEVLDGGLILTPKMGEKGEVGSVGTTAVWAKTPLDASGTNGACEDGP